MCCLSKVVNLYTPIMGMITLLTFVLIQHHPLIPASSTIPTLILINSYHISLRVPLVFFISTIIELSK